MEQEKLEKDIELIKERISRKPDLIITRIPPKVLERFKDFAYSEFCGDYGMAIRFLMDYLEGLLPTGLEQIQGRIMILEAEIAELKKAIPKSEEQKKPHNMMGQRIGTW